jgi:chromosomal replication initiation ATPase DnaA
VILGEEGFWERVKGKWMKNEGALQDKERPSLKALEKRGPEDVLRKAARYFQIEVQDLTKKRSGYRDQRALVMEMMYRYCGIKQRDVGRELGGMDYTQVSHERGRIRERMERDSKVKKWTRDIEALLISKTKI